MNGEPTNKSIFTFTLDEAEQERLVSILKNGNFKPKKIPYSIIAVEGDGFNCTLYAPRKGKKEAKLCIQGKKASEFVEFTVEPFVFLGVRTGGNAENEDKPHIGTDESGKGDYFGPLVVCAAYADGDLAPKMRAAGARDCKEMSDAQVLASGAKLRALLTKDRFTVVRIPPPAYNRLYTKTRNVNTLLAWAHARCIEDLLAKIPDCPRAVADQFSPVESTLKRALMERGKKITLEQRHKAENDIAVAAASVISREIFLRSMAETSTALGLPQDKPLPKGASDPRIEELAVKFVKERGAGFLAENCKCSFKTTDRILQACNLTRNDLPEEARTVSSSNLNPRKG